MRVVVVVLDSAGVGALPDAKSYGDDGANTLANVIERCPDISIPNLISLGLLHILGMGEGKAACAAYGRMAMVSPGKDTTTGHWELMGVILPVPFPVYPHGFPSDVIGEFERAIGRRVLGNVPASGTVIIEELGKEHMRTGCPIVYTSADSVFQVAAHEDIIPPEELYRICQIARDLLSGPHMVGRVIARPFTGQPGAFRRTARRKDFSAAPPARTVLDAVSEHGLSVTAVGKISDIFQGRGISRSLEAKDNAGAMAATLEALASSGDGLILANLVDFDMMYGHRNDAAGYARALEEVDRWLPGLLERMNHDDLLLVTADHGCDPTHPGTDHTREYVPLLAAGSSVMPGTDVGTRESGADLGASVCHYLGVPWEGPGTSFLDTICKKGCGEL
ncbi:MAG: phosphopentomutase [Bacillota bacterium]